MATARRTGSAASRAGRVDDLPSRQSHGAFAPHHPSADQAIQVSVHNVPSGPTHPAPDPWGATGSRDGAERGVEVTVAGGQRFRLDHGDPLAGQFDPPSARELYQFGTHEPVLDVTRAACVAVNRMNRRQQ
jgi:hypothetical protein